LLSANESYERAAQDLEMLTGRSVSHSTQQRLVHRQELALMAASTPVEELSVDGGKVRVRTPLGQPCDWRDYKAIQLHEQCIGASFRENQLLIDWANEQPLAATLTCLGDGHDGIWNIITEIGHEEQRREILGWYHLMENLAKVESSRERLDSVKDLLWEGKVKTAITQFEDCSDAHAQTFVAYLRKHQHRIVNYEYYQLEGISIGSGAIESGIKQIAARVKLTGAQWEAKNIPQVLRHRCAYLNGQFSTVTSPS
jgi:hypothetical protein